MNKLFGDNGLFFYFHIFMTLFDSSNFVIKTHIYKELLNKCILFGRILEGCKNGIKYANGNQKKSFIY